MKVQKKVRQLSDEIWTNIELSKSLCVQAENLLLGELGLKDFELKHDLPYTSNLFKVGMAHRMDAEHFQPTYNTLVQRILDHKDGYVRLLDCVENIRPSFNPQKYPDTIFSYVELADIDPSVGVIHSASKTTGEEAPSRARRILRRGNVIASSVEGSLDKVALVDEKHEGSLASTGFFQFRPVGILPEVLLVLSKGIVLQAQLKKECAGTILTAVPNKSLKRIVVALLSEKTQQKIASFIQQSHKARDKSKELLEEAKEKVEEAIENQLRQ